MREKGKGKSSKRTLKLSTPSMFMIVLLVSIAIAFTVPTVTPVMGQEAEVTVTVNAPESVEEGETFNVTIDVDDVINFNSAQFDLFFDSSVVNVKDVTEGSIDGEEIPVEMWDYVDSDTIRVMPMLPEVIGVNGSGYLAKISFDVEGEEGDESVLDVDNGLLFSNIVGADWAAEEILANWVDDKIIIGAEEEEEEEESTGEEVTPGSPNITAWKPAETVVSSVVGEARTFNVTVDQIADISWQINGTEVQTNESTKESVFTNTSAVIGTWNVSAIATNTTTGLSDRHTWIWSVTLTATPTPTLAPGVTPTSTLAPGETPMPATPIPTIGHKKTPKPATPTPTPTPKPKVPGFEVVFTIAVMLTIAYMLLRRR
jgi:hypothetical protein